MSTREASRKNYTEGTEFQIGRIDMVANTGTYIVEHLRGLEQLPDRGLSFSAVPPKIRGMGTFPVRAYARM